MALHQFAISVTLPASLAQALHRTNVYPAQSSTTMESRLFTTSLQTTPAQLPAPMAPYLQPLHPTSAKDAQMDAKLAQLPTPQSALFANQDSMLTVAFAIQLAPTIPLPLDLSVCFSVQLAIRVRLDQFQLVLFVAPIVSIMALQWPPRLPMEGITSSTGLICLKESVPTSLLLHFNRD